MKKTIILSFCLATYNQPEKVEQLLESMREEDLSGVEVIIRDDSNNLLTQEIVARYQDILPLNYLKMTKEGVDVAFLNLSDVANGDYVWWFGDDTIKKGIFSKLKKCFKKHPQLDFIYINSTDASGSSYSISMKGDELSTDRDYMALKLADQLGFCSALVFKRQLLRSGLSSAKELIGSSWVTLYLAHYVISIGNYFYIMDGNNFFSQDKLPGEIRWYDPFEVHCINYAIVLKRFKQSYRKGLIRELLNRKLESSCRAVVIERSLGFKTGFASNSPKIINMFKHYWTYPKCYLACFLMIIPRPSLVKARSLYLSLKKIK